MDNYVNHPTFIKQAEEAKAFLKKAELPEQLLKRLENSSNDAEKNYTLDDLGFLGTQEELTPAQEKDLQKKTGEAFVKS
ncbi:MAG: hypothetical protein ABIR18_04600 [Chitinophagaceae bacterium]